MHESSTRIVEFERQLAGVACTARAWARVPDAPGLEERRELKERIRRLLAERSAVLLAHYYVEPDIQNLAEETGGCVADSLEMARFGRAQEAPTLVVAGVPAEEFSAFCDRHPERTVVVYANTSAAVKARADWVVTSAIALDVARHLHEYGEKILWAPDRHLGAYVQNRTGADMLLWHGACVVHEEFKALELAAVKKEHPRAKVLVHPESPAEVIKLADAVGSTTQIIKAAQALDADEFIIATDGRQLQELRALPLDGHERACEPRRNARYRRERDPNRPGNRSPRVSADRPHARFRRTQERQRAGFGRSCQGRRLVRRRGAGLNAVCVVASRHLARTGRPRIFQGKADRLRQRPESFQGHISQEGKQ